METSVRPTAAHSAKPVTAHSEGCDLPNYEAIGVPTTVAAALAAMRFRDRSTDQICTIPDKDWTKFLAWAEGRQVALTIAGLWDDGFPARERALLGQSSEAFRARMVRIREAL